MSAAPWPARPFRFGFIVATRSAKRLGYSAVALNDHISLTLAPHMAQQVPRHRERT